MFRELNDNVSEMEDSIGKILAPFTPEICHRVMLSVPRRFQLRIQSGDRHFGHLCEIRNLQFSQGRTANSFAIGSMSALVLAAAAWLGITSEMMIAVAS